MARQGINLSNGIHVTIDEDGYFGPDANDGVPLFVAGRIAQTGDQREWGLERPDSPGASARRTRREGIEDRMRELGWLR